MECNCGCIVFSGWVFEETITVMYKGKPKTVIYTHCGDDDHPARAMRECLDNYVDVEEYHVQTARDKELEMADEREED